MKSRTIAVMAALMLLALAGVIYAQGDYSSPVPAQAGGAVDLKAQVKTAVTHAGFAGSGNSMGYVQQHLGHALNCLEGTKGKNFNKAWGHVCEGQGNGILTDLKSASGGASLMLVASHADSLALSGVKSKDLAEAKAAAKGVGALLAVIQENVK